MSALWLKILAGVLAVGGIVAMVLALTLAPLPTLAVAAAGTAAVLAGIGLFCASDRIAPPTPAPILENPHRLDWY